MTPPEVIEEWFNVRYPNKKNLLKFVKISNAAKILAHTINKLAPDCADKSAAFRKIREATLTAFDAICLNGK